MRLLLGLILAAAGHARANGFEKGYFWEAEYAARGGAASSSVGAPSLLYNPAGLIHAPKDNDLSLNVSPIFGADRAPIVTDDAAIDGEKSTTPVGGLLYNRKFGDKFAAGIGYYGIGGTGINYKDIDFSSLNYTLKPDVGANLALSEVGLGAAYKVSEQLSVGATIRMVMAKASYNSADITKNAGGPNVNLLSTFKTGDMTANQTGFRVGIQYKATEDCGVGLNYRSAVDLEMKSDPTGEGQLTGGTAVPVKYSETKISTSFPQAVNLGGFYRASGDVTWYYELGWINYAKNRALEFDGTATVGANPAVAISDVDLKWKDETNLQLGTELRQWSMPLRLGVTYATQVTNAQYAYASSLAPGPAFTLAAGSSWKINEDSSLDFAYDYSKVAGKAKDPAVAKSKEGNYENIGQTLHLTYNMNF